MGRRPLARLVAALGAALAPAAATAGPAAADVPGVPMIRQQLSLSCEAAALQMTLAHEGIPRSQQQLLAGMGVDLRHPGAGYRGGGDPYRSFVGRPNGSELRRTGYGAYFPPVAAAAARAGGQVQLAAEGIPAATVYAYVGQGHPAIVWVTFDWRRHARHDYPAWDGRWVPYAGPVEHTVVVTGVDAASVLVNDPARGSYRIARAAFEPAYELYGGMVVVLA